MKKYALFAVATLASIFAPSLCAYPSYPYPYEYKGASATGPWQYSADGGTSAGFAVPAGNIKNGELIGYSAGVTLPYKVSWDVQASISFGQQAGHVDETYKLSAFGQTSQVNKVIWWRCEYYNSCYGTTGDHYPLTPSPSLGVAFNNVPRFDSFRSSGNSNWASQYESAITPLLGGTTVDFSVDSKKFDDKGKVVSFSNDSTYTGGGGYQFRPWTTYDVLSGTIQPEVGTVSPPGGIKYPNAIRVDPTPLFGFAPKEAANLNDYDHFNWLSKIVQFGTGQAPGMEGESLLFFPEGANSADLATVDGIFGRNFGPDPGIGCYISIFDKCPDGLITDLSPLVYDENLSLPKGRKADNWKGEAADGWGLRFADAPNLLTKGHQAVFETSLVGVRSSGVDNPADYDILPNTVFRWTYTQLENSPVGLGGAGKIILFNTDPTQAGIGRIDFLGFGSFAHYGLTVTGDIPNNDPIPFPEFGGNGTGNNPGTGSGQSVSEPGALTLFLTGIVSLAFAVRRRRV